MTEPKELPKKTSDYWLMIRRTLTPQLWSLVLLLLGEWGINMTWLTERPVTMFITQFALSGLIYALALVIGPKLPIVEKILLSSDQRPISYDADNVYVVRKDDYTG